MRFRSDRRGFIFSLDATLAMLVVLIVMAGVARVGGPELVYGQHGYLRLERYANDALEVLQLTGTMKNIKNLIKQGANENAENLVRGELRKILPADVQFKLVIGDNMLTVYPDNNVNYWNNAFSRADEIAAATRMLTWLKRVEVDNDTIALYRLNESSGVKVPNETGIDNGTIWFNATWTAGIFGNALNFDAGGERVEVSDSPRFSPPGGLPKLTVEFWYYLQNSAGNVRIIDKYIQTVPPTRYRGWFIEKQTATDPNKFQLSMQVGTELNYRNYCVNNVANKQEWVHIAMVWDGSELYMFVNGENITGGNYWGLGTGNISNTVEPLRFGIWSGLNDNCLIDELRIENRALTAEEIAADAAAGWGFKPVTLHVWRGSRVGG